MIAIADTIPQSKAEGMRVEAWHFCEADRRLRYGDERKIVVGQTLTVDGELSLCERGLHASRQVLDALKYATAPVVCRVVLSGKVVEGEDKCVASERTVLSMADATKELRLFTVWCAGRALARERRAGRIPDPRSIAALRVASKYARGLATEEELTAARAAAWAAAWAAEWAAWRAAERDAAWAAAWAAEWAVWRAAERDAAWDAERAVQNARLETVLTRLLESTESEIF